MIYLILGRDVSGRDLPDPTFQVCDLLLLTKSLLLVRKKTIKKVHF